MPVFFRALRVHARRTAPAFAATIVTGAAENLSPVIIEEAGRVGTVLIRAIGNFSTLMIQALDNLASIIPRLINIYANEIHRELDERELKVVGEILPQLDEHLNNIDENVSVSVREGSILIYLASKHEIDCAAYIQAVFEFCKEHSVFEINDGDKIHLDIELYEDIDKINQRDTFENVYVKDPTPENENDDRSVLGKGAFGVTHRMINTVDKGVYAVKEIDVSDALSAGIKKDELLKEAMTLQKLNHPHIVRYFTSYFSRNETLFNVVMELISGGSLADKISDPGVSVVDIRRWLSQMASTLHYLHSEMRTLHRDIKAENIMLTSGSGGVGGISSGSSRIKLIGFGTASEMKTVASKMSRVGTSTYFSYEKANDIPYDGRDDVWGAGCVFAELLVKARLSERGGAIHMFHNKTVNDRRLQLIGDCVKVDVGLGSVIGRMLEPEQERRCTSEELVRLMTAVVPSTSASFPQKQLLEAKFPTPVIAASLTSSNKSASTAAFVSSQWSEKASWDVGDYAKVKFSPNGSVIAVAPWESSNILIYDPSGRLITTLEESDKNVTCLSFSPDGTKLAASSRNDNCVKLFEVSSDRLLWSTTVDMTYQICFSNSSSLVASDGFDKSCVIIDVSSGSITSRISADGSRGLCVSDSGTLITAGETNKVTIWDNLNSLRLSFDCSGLWSMCINSDGSLIYVGTTKGDIRVYSDSGLVIREVKKAHSSYVRSLSLNETNSVLASGGADKEVKLWDVSTLECIQTLEGHTHRIMSVSFSPNNNLVSGSEDMSVKVWSCC